MRFWLGTRLVVATAFVIDLIHTHILRLRLLSSPTARLNGALLDLIPPTIQTWMRTQWPEWFRSPNVVEFVRRTYRQWPGEPQKRSLRLLVRRPDVRWHVTVTFQDAPKVPEATPSSH
ncbi:hypothetical protein B0T24DRAFT_629864 [Lasiosphaeria ovina]|uniref:Uncharacterized protein n=1 Tax=Lasiosphaeria ovina TaxID=92902 RepID=A0AAE0K8K3_9PEZI|nr:hypothetical protein B0T24DRAFT_629864 [Lasiosphaeria ovina]